MNGRRHPYAIADPTRNPSMQPLRPEERKPMTEVELHVKNLPEVLAPERRTNQVIRLMHPLQGQPLGEKSSNHQTPGVNVLEPTQEKRNYA